jgi:hypothetical protein
MSKSQGAGSSYSDDRRDAAPDTQALIGLLENLVPLLLNFQTRSFGQAGPVGIPGAAVQDQQAAVAFTEDITLDSLRNLSSYLQRNAGRYPGLDTYTGVIADARKALAAQDYQRALGLVFEAYRAIAVLRAIRPELPPVRARSQDEAAATGRDAVH